MAAADIVFVVRELNRLGLNTGSSGNVSERDGTGMLITRSGADAGLDKRDLVTVAADGTANHGVPSSEWPMHRAVYDVCPDAGAIVHSHADACSALACLGESLPAFHYMVLSFGGEDIRCAPYVTFGTPELARLAGEAIMGRTACLLANHGMICHGRDARSALATALRLEAMCRQYLLARSAGRPRLLTPAEMTAAKERFRSYEEGRG